MSWIERKIERATKQAFDDFVASDRFGKMLDEIVREHPVVKFTNWAKFEMMRVDPSLAPRKAWDMARNAINEFLRDEKITFGDPRFAWDKQGAIDLIHAVEIEHWERSP